MKKKITCIECPKGCWLSADIKNNKVVSVKGNECLKGKKYAHAEIEHPVRILTTTVLTKGLALKTIPVRTDKPVPKPLLLKAMKKIKQIRNDDPLAAEKKDCPRCGEAAR